MSCTLQHTFVMLMTLSLTPFVHGESIRVLTDSPPSAEPTLPPSEMMLQAELMDDFDAAWKQRSERYEKIFDQKSPQQDVEAYQQRLRDLFVANLGGWPQRTPLNARIVGEGAGDGFRYQKIIYESRPGFHVTAILFLPTSDPPYPGVLVPCGHSATGKGEEAYQRACILLARHGMAALCYDAIGQGDRHQVFDRNGKPAFGSTHEHTLLGQSCILLGTNLATYRIWDGMRGIDYLCSRDDIRADRIGVTGNSGGGTLTSFIGALDDRVVCSAPSCYITSTPALLETLGPQDAEQNIHAQFSFGMGLSDYLVLRAPKPVLICAATKDFFPIEGTWDSFRRAKRIYTLLGVPERVDLVEANEPHGFSQRLREGAVQWMQRWLLDRDEDVREQEVAVLTAEQIRCTPEGEVLKMDGARSVVDINVEEAKRLSERRCSQWAEWDYDQRVAKVRETAAIRPLEDIPEVQTENVGRVDRDGDTITKWILRYREKIALPALEFVPEKSDAPTVLYLHNEGKEAVMGAGGAIDTLVADGHRVWAVDLSGFGETTPQQRYKGWAPRFGECWQQFFLAYMLDKSLVGIRTEDILACARYLNDTGENGTNTPVRLIAHGACTIPALHAAALHPELFSEVRLILGLRSWENVVNLGVRPRQLEGTVHGVLRVYDLPDLADMAASRTKVIWVDPVDAAMSPVIDEVQDVHAMLRQRTQQVFERSAFLKPNEATADEELVRLAPLIIQQTDSADAFADYTFGREIGKEAGASPGDDARMQVFTWGGRVRMGDRDLRRSTFVWFYGRTPDDSGSPARGFHMIRDEQGYPIVWQAIGGTRGVHVLYVSKSLEARAAEVHGEPLPGRAFAIETPLDERPDVVVARVLEDGPIPMGPYVYLDDRIEITTILCRCMPSQIDEFVVNDSYDLVPLKGFDDLKLDPERKRELRPGPLPEPLDLGSALRWP